MASKLIARQSYLCADRESDPSGGQAQSLRLPLLRAECLLDVFSPDAVPVPHAPG